MCIFTYHEPVLIILSAGRFFVDKGAGKTPKRVLSSTTKSRFLQTEILCVEYDSLGPEQEEDLFSRVQLGVPLTPAEKLKASTGEWQTFASDVESTYANLMNSRNLYPNPPKIPVLILSNIGVDNKRARSFQLVLQIFKQMTYYEEGKPATFNSGPAALKKFCQNESLLTSEFRREVTRVFNTYAEILEQFPKTFENHDYRIAAKYSPIEFVAMALLIYIHPERQNIALLSGDILALRSFVRETRQDLRSNSATWIVFMDWISNIERYRGGFNTVRARRAGMSSVSSSITSSVANRVAGRVSRHLAEPAPEPVSAPVADMSNAIAAQPRNVTNQTTPSMRYPAGMHLGNLGPGQASSSSGTKGLPPRPARLQLPFPTAPSSTDRRQGRTEADSNRPRKRARGENRGEDDEGGSRRIKEERLKELERVGPFTNS